MGKAGVKVRVRCVSPGPWGGSLPNVGVWIGDAEPQVGVVLCPLLRGPISQVGLAWVGWPMG